MIRDTGSFDAKTENALFLTTPRHGTQSFGTELVLEPNMARKGRDILEVFYTPRRGCRLDSHDLEEYLITRSFLLEGTKKLKEVCAPRAAKGVEPTAKVTLRAHALFCERFAWGHPLPFIVAQGHPSPALQCADIHHLFCHHPSCFHGGGVED